jgi:hypothetical protein
MSASMRMTALWAIPVCSLVEVDRRFRYALMFVAVRVAERSVCFNETTRLYIPESCHIQYLIL